MSHQHEKFLQRLAASSRAVMVVAEMQHAKGRSIEIPRVRCAPSATDADDYIDGGDLFVVTRHRIEVKHIGHDFHDADDWPFREVFVSNQAAVDRANGEVVAYVTVSRNLGHVAIVGKETRPHWYLVETLARNTLNVEKFYACPLSLVVFEPTPFAVQP